MDNISPQTIKKYIELLEQSVLDLELETRTLQTFLVDPDLHKMKEKIGQDLTAGKLALKFAKKKLEIAKVIK